MTDVELIHKLASALEFIHAQAHTHAGWVALEAYDSWVERNNYPKSCGCTVFPEPLPEYWKPGMHSHSIPIFCDEHRRASHEHKMEMQ